MRGYAEELDARDQLAGFRHEFYIPEDTIYLDGNSLGLCSRRAERCLLSLLDSWKKYAIDGWLEGENPWFYLSESLGAMMATLVGAHAHEVIVTGSTSVNLHQMLATFYKPTGERNKIVTDELSFPTDIYALKSHILLHDFNPATHLVRVPSEDGICIDENEIVASMTEDVALVVLPTVLYRSGQLLNIERITYEAHQRGIQIGWDACHSAGVVPHQFSKWEVDFAFWCTYKYLNGGPGSVAAIYVNQKYKGRVPGLAGWFSSLKEAQFDMDHNLRHAEYASAFQIGTPHVLSTAPLIGSLEIMQEASIERIRDKSLKLTGYLMDLVQSELIDWGFTIGNPEQTSSRGGHVCLIHEEALRICKALRELNVIPDYRKPNCIRLAPVALYTSYVDVWEAVRRLKMIMVEEKYKKYTNEREVIA